MIGKLDVNMLKVNDFIHDGTDKVRVIYVPENRGENYIVVEDKYTNFPFPENVTYYRLFNDELKDWELVK